MKLSRERSAANLHAAFEAEGTGNGKMAKLNRARKSETIDTDKLEPRTSPRQFSTLHSRNITGLPRSTLLTELLKLLLIHR